MTEPHEQWDDVVDVIGVGTAAGVLAYLSACAAADLDVLHVAAPARYDPDTAAYLAAMTEDLAAGPDRGDACSCRATPEPLRRDARGRPDVLEPFVGEELRAWSARCVASPSGVLFTHVPTIFTRMRGDAGEVITAIEVTESDEAAPVGHYAGLIYNEWGVLAGALVDGPSGPQRVRAEAGLAFGIGAAAPGWPAGANALVSRPAGRFARLEPLRIGAAGD